MFDQLVHPTMRFVRAVLPQMIEREAGKILVDFASPGWMTVLPSLSRSRNSS